MENIKNVANHQPSMVHKLKLRPLKGMMKTLLIIIGLVRSSVEVVIFVSGFRIFKLVFCRNLEQKLVGG